MTNDDYPAPDVKNMTRRQLVEWAVNHPDVKAQNAADPLVQDRTRLYNEAMDATDLKQDLAEAGYPIKEDVSELYYQYGRYEGAFPALLKWLPRVSYRFLLEEIIRALSVPQAKKLAYPIFLMKFHDPPYAEDPMRPASNPKPIAEDIRWLFGNGLNAYAGPDVADDLIQIAQDRSYREDRTAIVKALPKTKDPRVRDVLVGLLDDPSVAAYAVEALGLLRAADSEDIIESMLDNPDKNVRDQAKKALKRIRNARR